MLESLSSETTRPSAFQPRYQTIAPIGRGGMAEVFLSVMTGAGGISKLAVLKQIWPELSGDPHFVAMFLDEARLSVRMSHPNLVQTYEVIDDGERLAIAMEYLDGQPLARVLNRLRGPQELALPLRLRIAAKVLAALDYAHELADYDGTPLAVVHRDVSPHNVFITYDGGVKLVDFGVAKNLANANQTRPGALKGKFSYMAPEQFLGRSSDRRADIFAVGIMLWEMLAGRRFWNGASDAEIASHLVSDRPFPSLPPDLGVPVGVEAICTRALQRDRNRRYATAADMEADVEHVLTGARYAFERPLAKAVAVAFAPERAQRQLLVDHHLRRVRSGSYSGFSVISVEHTSPELTRSAVSRAIVMPPPPPPPRAAVAAATAAARSRSRSRSLWPLSLRARRILRSSVAGVAIAAPLAALIVLFIGGHAGISSTRATVSQPSPSRTTAATLLGRLTNEPMDDAYFFARRAKPVEHVIGRTDRIEHAAIAPTIVELPPPPRAPQAPPPARHRRRVASVEPPPIDPFAAPVAPLPSPQRSRGGFTDSTAVQLRPRPIDVVNPFVVPSSAAVSAAPAR
jgi:serine/threonine-protein kinase